MPDTHLVSSGSSALFIRQFATLDLTIADSSGRVVTKANVTVHSVDTGVVWTGDSDKVGLTAISALPAAQYKVTVPPTGLELTRRCLLSH